MTQQNAPVLDKHEREAMASFINPEDIGDYEKRFAQTLANLEAARAENADLNNRLAEIDRIAHSEAWTVDAKIVRIRAALASGHTPSPCPSCNGLNISCPEGCERDPLTGELIPWACPGCAAKDEAMAELAREVSDAVVEFGKSSRFDVARTAEAYHSHLSRFIIPPADPVAEALKAAMKPWAAHITPSQFDQMAEGIAAELKSRLPLGGAK